MPNTARYERSPLVSSEILLGSEEAAQELKIDLGPILREHSIDQAVLHTPSGYLRHSQVTRFFQVVAERYHVDHFGFLVGKHQPPMQLGAVGLAMRNSPTLGAAIENGLRYHHSYSEGSKHDLNVNQGLASVRRWDRRSYPFGSTQMRMLGIVLVFKVLKTLSGAAWRPGMVTYTFSEPEQSNQILSYFGCPVLFDQEFDSICFPDSDLSRPVAGSNSELLKLAKTQLDRSFSRKGLEQEISELAKQYIRSNMGTQRCTLEGCAQFLHINPRTLQRELDRRDRNFRQLHLNIRMDIARQYLSDSNRTLGDLAEILGYRNQSAFSRAFKLEHGVSPKQWRETARN